MLSGRTRILMRVRIPIDALRLTTLVVAGVTSGYLWRAAFEPSGSTPAAPPPQLVIATRAPEPPVRITVTEAPPARRTTPARRGVGLAAARPERPRPAAAPARVSSGPSPPVKTPRPAAPEPAPQQPAPAAPAPPPASAPSPAAAAQAPAAPAPAPATPPTVSQEGAGGSRPGWGHGDKNHDHAGPGNGEKDKKNG